MAGGVRLEVGGVEEADGREHDVGNVEQGHLPVPLASRQDHRLPHHVRCLRGEGR